MIDTAQKQVSFLNWHGNRSLPLPNGAFDSADLQTMLRRYGGILFGDPPVIILPNVKAVSIKNQFVYAEVKKEIEYKRLLNAIKTDLDNLLTSVSGMTAQLDDDSGINDTDYAANHNPINKKLLK